jgi:hypothetical protein
MSAPPGRFPPPWRVEEEDRGEVLKVLDAKGQILAYVLYEDEPILPRADETADQGRSAVGSRSISPSSRSCWGCPRRHKRHRFAVRAPTCLLLEEEQGAKPGR